MECEGKNAHGENKTVYRVKVQVEELENLLVQKMLTRVSGESWKKQETKESARLLRLSARTV